jgi:hypothetical protein
MKDAICKQAGTYQRLSRAEQNVNKRRTQKKRRADGKREIMYFPSLMRGEKL